MKLKVIAISVLVLGALAIGIVFSNTANVVFFDSIPWIIFLAAGLGLVLGAARAILKGREEISYGEVTRHGSGAFFEHWGTAFGIFLALASAILMGFLFFPHIINTPNTIDFPLNMHFVGVVVTVFGGFFFIGDYLLSRNVGKLIPNIPDIIGGTIAKYLLRRRWTAEDKYLSSQKAAFLGFAVIGAVILITGAIKVAAHIWPITADWWSVANVLHDLFSFLFMLLLFVHIALVLALPAHWPSLTSWLTGKVSEEYAEEEHPVWDEELKTGKRRGYRLL